ncbi:hypothetical protein [Streptomyces melanosporofaciens]|uniref:Uncharacterized protein n=1 Tax=Streptomyces melanosporofaciens TaxID=67327 RepID=A0A1H5A4A1_STRMJ|nr:hypothetical protein [Streptomyces melanosporofaciens]SED36748.1 hypothetical protein SAMN04490356_8153 [Streptomyces melanosporofaciens]
MTRRPSAAAFAATWAACRYERPGAATTITGDSGGRANRSTWHHSSRSCPVAKTPEVSITLAAAKSAVPWQGPLPSTLSTAASAMRSAVSRHRALAASAVASIGPASAVSSPRSASASGPLRRPRSSPSRMAISSRPSRLAW